MLDPGPVPRGEDWLAQVQEPATEAEWARLQESLKRRRPFGGDAWIESTARKLGLQATLRPVGRPRKKAQDKTEDMSPLFGLGEKGMTPFDSPFYETSCFLQASRAF